MALTDTHYKRVTFEVGDLVWTILQVKGINKQVKKTVTNINAKYKALTDTHYRKVVFEVGDLV
jgi:hypothetical protein